MFGLLWGRSRRVWVPACHIAPFPRVVKMEFRSAMGIAPRFKAYACGTEIRRGVFRLGRIGESRIYRPFCGRVIEGRKNSPGNFALGGCSLFVETESGRTRREQSTCCCRIPLVVQNQYSKRQAAECSRSLHSRHSRVQGTASRRAFETGCLHTWQTPNVPCVIRASASSIARKRRASVWCKRI